MYFMNKLINGKERNKILFAASFVYFSVLSHPRIIRIKAKCHIYSIGQLVLENTTVSATLKLWNLDKDQTTKANNEHRYKRNDEIEMQNVKG